MAEKPFDRFKRHAAEKPKNPGGVFKFQTNAPDPKEEKEPQGDQEPKKRGRKPKEPQE